MDINELMEEPVNRIFTAPLYSGEGDSGFPVSNYILFKYQQLPMYYSFHDETMVAKEWYKEFIEKYPTAKLIHTSSWYTNKKEATSVYTYEIEELKICIRLYPQNRYKVLGESDFTVSIHYIDRGLIEDIIGSMKTFYKKRRMPRPSSEISLIVQRSNGHLDTEEYPIKIKELDVALNYGENFVPVFNKIVQRLNKKNDKGIILFHGVPGTGKTSLIKYLTKKVRKQFMFVPPSMAESITSPSFIPFLMEHPNSILVLEDAERVLSARDNNYGNQGVSNILNVSDGILGDCLNIQIIATFNTNLKNIDEALLRKGRLIAEHEMKKLDVDAANKLLAHLGKDYITKKAMPLTDIYNIDQEVYKTIQEKGSVGFTNKY